jgi:hypothetical protein
MQLSVEEWRQLLLKFGIQVPPGDLEFLARASATPAPELQPRLASEPQLVQVPAPWERAG